MQQEWQRSDDHCTTAAPEVKRRRRASDGKQHWQSESHASTPGGRTASNAMFDVLMQFVQEAERKRQEEMKVGITRIVEGIDSVKCEVADIRM